MKKLKKYKNLIIIIIAVLLVIGIVVGVTKIMPRYHNPYAKDNISKDIGLVVGGKDETDRLVNKIILKDDKILFSYANMNRFIDAYIQKDDKYGQVITNSKFHTKVIDVENKKVREYLSDDWQDIYLETIDDVIYFDINELQDIYGIEVEYIDETNLVKISKDIHTYSVVKVKNIAHLKTLPSGISATIDNLQIDDKLYVLNEDKDYYRIVDSKGRFGYIKQNEVSEIEKISKYEPQVKYDKKVSMIWDYMYLVSPNRSNESKINGVNVFSPTWIDLLDDKGNVQNKVDQNYLSWANMQGYDLWVMFSNNSMIEATHSIMIDSKLREKLVEKVLKICVDNKFEGINVDFEYMYKADRDLYSQFIRELTIAFHNNNMIVSVDVTVPDGSDNWSLCFDRKAIGDSADYVVLMAYDQTAGTSKKAGSNSALNWVNTNIEKLLLEVDNEKLIVGLPLYMRVWKITDTKTTSSVINMKDLDSYVRGFLSNNMIKNWVEEEGQYLIEDKINNVEYKIWVEDLKSIEEKLKICQTHNVAGVSFWEKDRELSGLWQIVNTYINNN